MQLIDTIKMISYWADTAMAKSLGEILSHSDETSRLLQSLYTTEVDLFSRTRKKGKRLANYLFPRLCGFPMMGSSHINIREIHNAAERIEKTELAPALA
ncbi:MAG: hypothetical protein QNJ78_08395 [Gammaproteobacteria bacterium]|nr:hypothetical protein [Gammaproteobacteria bacterium]